MESFGYKYGLPMDADMVMDVRFLPNPHWVDELRPHTGQHPAVRDYVLGQPGADGVPATPTISCWTSSSTDTAGRGSAT